MSELDESIAVGAIEDASNNSAVFAMLLLALTLTIQLVLFFKSRNATQRVTAAMLMGLALAVWVTKVLA
jgi:RsiW-degrading membrane proteinase PrsW (M82 family)